MVDDFRSRGGSPWGSPPGGGGNGSGRRGPTPPNIDEIIKTLQDKINKFLPGGASKGGKPLIFGVEVSMDDYLEFIRTPLRDQSDKAQEILSRF